MFRVRTLVSLRLRARCSETKSLLLVSYRILCLSIYHSRLLSRVGRKSVEDRYRLYRASHTQLLLLLLLLRRSKEADSVVPPPERSTPRPRFPARMSSPPPTGCRRSSVRFGCGTHAGTSFPPGTVRGLLSPVHRRSSPKESYEPVPTKMSKTDPFVSPPVRP